MARRLTEEELQARQDRIDELRIQINELQAERRRLVARQSYIFTSRKRWAKRTPKALQGVAFEMFGKRYKDLTKDELREYNKVVQKRWRERNRID